MSAVHLYVFFRKKCLLACPANILKIVLLASLILSYVSSLYTLNVNTFANIFSHLLGCLFIMFMVYFKDFFCYVKLFKFYLDSFVYFCFSFSYLKRKIYIYIYIYIFLRLMPKHIVYVFY